MAYGGNGGIGHLAGELFRMMVQLPFTGVAYRGTGPALVEVTGGQVQFMFATLPGAIPLIGSGKIRALAVTSIDRAAVAKDVPTMDESGLRGYQITNWYGILAPARTPSPIVDRLYKEIVTIVQQPDIRTKFAAGGVDPLWSQSPQEFRNFLASEVKKWAKVTQASGMKVE
jgi:tripartite-type tricarboxylate transporter receptor subunit TctC